MNLFRVVAKIVWNRVHIINLTICSVAQLPKTYVDYTEFLRIPYKPAAHFLPTHEILSLRFPVTFQTLLLD